MDHSAARAEVLGTAIDRLEGAVKEGDEARPQPVGTTTFHLGHNVREWARDNDVPVEYGLVVDFALNDTGPAVVLLTDRMSTHWLQYRKPAARRFSSVASVRLVEIPAVSIDPSTATPYGPAALRPWIGKALVSAGVAMLESRGSYAWRLVAAARTLHDVAGVA